MKKYSEKKILENFKGFTYGGTAYSMIDGITVYWTYCAGYDSNFHLTEYREDSDRIKYGYEGWDDFRVDDIPATCRCKDAVSKFESAQRIFYEKNK